MPDMTLADLARNSRLQSTHKRVPQQPKQLQPLGPGMNAKAVAIDQSVITERFNQNAPKEKEPEDAPIVQNAFAGLEERRAKALAAGEIIKRNAQELALENEVAEIEAESGNAGGVVDENPDFSPSDTEGEDFFFDNNTVSTTSVAPPDDFLGSLGIESLEETPQENTGDSMNFVPAGMEEEPVAIQQTVEIEEPQAVTESVVISGMYEDDKDSMGELNNLMKDLDAEQIVVDEGEETAKQIRSRFRESMTNVPVISKPINLATVKIARPITDTSALLNNINQNRRVKTADWPLYHTGRCVTWMECGGPELDRLRKSINNANALNAVILSLKFFYNHIFDANKPSFEEWCKTVRTEDLESIYYGPYRATYADANIVSRVCEKHDDPNDKSGRRQIGCGKTSIISINIDDMVKYGGEDDDSEEIKKNFKRLFNKDTTTPTHVIQDHLMQISDNFAIAYGDATLYSTFIQFSAISPSIVSKYEDTLNTLAYIKEFYAIQGDGSIAPIQSQVYKNDMNKTVLARIKLYTSILQTLTSDQYGNLIGKLNNLVETPKITYRLPEVKCPICGATIPAEDVDGENNSMLNILFLRAQLAQLKSL